MRIMNTLHTGYEWNVNVSWHGMAYATIVSFDSFAFVSAIKSLCLGQEEL